VRQLIHRAYAVFQTGLVNPQAAATPIEGGPAWIDSDRYDITAKAQGDVTVALMGGPMLRTLLEDRFKLKIHREVREVPVYRVTLSKGGFKLKPLPEGSCFLIVPGAERASGPPDTGGKPFCGENIAPLPQPDQIALEIASYGATMEQFLSTVAVRLAAVRHMDSRRVIDNAGITGRCEFHLKFTLSDDPSSDSTAPSIETALQEQLGLKLESGKGPGEAFVIDSIERPSEN